MEILLAVVGLFSLLFGFLGLIHPRITVKPPFARTRKRLVAFYGALFVGCMVGTTILQAPPSAEELEAQRVERIATLDAKARAIPASDAVANLAAYEELLRLVPDDERYLSKVEHYRPLAEEQQVARAAAAAERQKEQERIQAERTKEQARIQAAKAKEAARIRAINEERERKHGEAPINSGWDGSVLEVKNYIKSVAKDPGSVKYEAWGPVEYSEERGWVVQCDWRAKNSFGGYVRTVNTFYIRFGRVVDVE